MKSRLLPWPRRAFLHLRESGGALAVVLGTVLLFLVLDAAAGGLSGEGTALVVVLGVPLALAARGPGVRAGIATLWVQKPVDPVRYYLAGAAWDVVVAVGATLILLSILGIVALRVGLDPLAHPIWTIGALAAVTLVVASMASGASMWFPRAGRLLTLAVLIFTLYLRANTALNPSLGDLPWIRWVSPVLPPWESFVLLLDPEALDAPAAARALMWILLYAAVWIGAGVLGLRRLLANGALCRMRSS